MNKNDSAGVLLWKESISIVFGSIIDGFLGVRQRNGMVHVHNYENDLCRKIALISSCIQ
jgi:hypothetical protein